MVTRLKRVLKFNIIAALIAVIMIMTTFSALSEMSTVKAAPLSPEFDLSRIYLKNPFSHNVSLEIGTGEDILRFDGTLSKQVKLSGEEIQEIAMRVLSEMGITFLEFRTMQAEVKKSLNEPKTMTTEEREQFISDLLALLNLGDTGDVIGLYNKVAAGKSDEEAIKEALIEKVLETAGPIGALDAVERSWQSYDNKWQNFEYINKSKIKIDAFYELLQQEIDKYKAEKGYKGVILFKGTAIRSGFNFLNNLSENAPVNTQLWTLEIMLDQKTVTGEDTIEGATNGELGSLAGLYEGRYKLNVKSNLKNFAYGYCCSYDNNPLQSQTALNLNSMAQTVAINTSCDWCDQIYPNGKFEDQVYFDDNAMASVDWEIVGACEAEVFENGSMVLGVAEDRIESIFNNFSDLKGNQSVVAGRSKLNNEIYTNVYYATVNIPIEVKAIPNQKKVYIEYTNSLYNDITISITSDFSLCNQCALSMGDALSNRLNQGGWYDVEYAWDYRIHSPWEDEQGILQPMLLSLTE